MSKKKAKPKPNLTMAGTPRLRNNYFCGKCNGCLRKDDCAECRFCLDKPKFGGPNRIVDNRNIFEAKIPNMKIEPFGKVDIGENQEFVQNIHYSNHVGLNVALLFTEPFGQNREENIIRLFTETG